MTKPKTVKAKAKTKPAIEPQTAPVHVEVPITVIVRGEIRSLSAGQEARLMAAIAEITGLPCVFAEVNWGMRIDVLD